MKLHLWLRPYICPYGPLTSFIQINKLSHALTDDIWLVYAFYSSLLLNYTCGETKFVVFWNITRNMLQCSKFFKNNVEACYLLDSKWIPWCKATYCLMLDCFPCSIQFHNKLAITFPTSVLQIRNLHCHIQLVL